MKRIKVRKSLTMIVWNWMEGARLYWIK